MRYPLALLRWNLHERTHRDTDRTRNQPADDQSPRWDRYSRPRSQEPHQLRHLDSPHPASNSPLLNRHRRRGLHR